jgi:arylsulfatase A-like enzyme
LLAVPSIWAGGLVPHVMRQPDVPGRNALLKLLDGNDYRRFMDMDSVVETFDLRDRRLIELNPGHATWAATDFCTTVDAFERQLPRDRAQPTFFYSLPQNIHPTVALQQKVPAGETYPAGFDARVASSLHRVDACFGRFMDVLKREHLYEDSVIIVTSDHGDLLGEEGRWGHSMWLYPDVMKIPLIVHLPSWLRTSYRTDLDARVFSSDIAPSLYTLVGYQPADLGPMFGRSFFTPRDGDSSWRRREMSLVASSYGAVYGVLSQNGRRLYVVDTVDATEYAMDLTGEPRRLTVTPAMMAVNRRAIEDRLRALATFYRYEK